MGLKDKAKEAAKHKVKQCKNSPNGKHQYVRWVDKGHVAVHCKHCGKLH